MKVSVILGHPRRGSFNHAIAKRCVQTLQRNGYDVFFHDLYEEGFDPILPDGEIPGGAVIGAGIERHCSEIAAADGIIIVHPNWWGMPPAILKGWVDRVLRPGVAYQFVEGDLGDGVPVGLLKAETVLVFNTSDTLKEREIKEFGDPLETIWKNCIFGLCGAGRFYRKMFGVMITSTLDGRQRWLDEVQETVDRFFPCKLL